MTLAGGDQEGQRLLSVLDRQVHSQVYRQPPRVPMAPGRPRGKRWSFAIPQVIRNQVGGQVAESVQTRRQTPTELPRAGSQTIGNRFGSAPATEPRLRKLAERGVVPIPVVGDHHVVRLSP